MRFIFRTHSDDTSGLGHLVRCTHVAKVLRDRGAEVLFVVDHISDAISVFLETFDVLSLYDEPQQTLDPIDDGEKFCATVGAWDWVVVDDYRLGQVWEKTVSSSGGKVCAFDDIVRDHDCDAVVDMKWRGIETANAYDGHVPNRALKLLGPRYIVLSPPYKTARPTSSPHERFQVLVSIGGGGNALIVEKIVRVLLDCALEVDLNVVLGPYMYNVNVFYDLAAQHENLKLIENATDLFSYVQNTDLYLGAAGGTLYQTLALRIPALTFSLADNQVSETKILEDIGHYFHINALHDDEITQLATFVDRVVQHYARIKTLYAQPKVPIDGQGSERIVEALYTGAQTERLTLYDLQADGQEGERLSEIHRIRKVTDRDINHYLKCRNLPINAEKMIGSAQISKLHHYNWWFTANRSNYLLTKADEPALYIWHEKVRYGSQSFLIGGWFACSEDVNFQDSITALNWQLNHCDEYYPGTPWISAVHRNNQFVQLLSTYTGFKQLDASHDYYDAVSNVFAKADPGLFNFYYRTGVPAALKSVVAQ